MIDSEAIGHSPGYASAFFNRAVALRAKGEEKEAIQDHNVAIRLEPLLGQLPCTEELTQDVDDLHRQMLKAVANNFRK